MQTLRRTAAILTFPAIVYLGAACERTDAPTGARPMASVAGPARLLVDDDLLQCPTAQYTSIQAAVTAAAPGDQIDVCPGTYMEQVIIPLGKDNIRLRSTRRWAAVIKAPMLMVPYNGNNIIVRVAGAQNVTILAFTITGPGPGGCGTLHYGVRVDNGGSADILGNHITQIRDNPFSGCQNGVAVQVGRQFEGTTGSARIMGNVIDHYQKNGPTVDNGGSHADIVNNRILGVGPTAVTAQNGVQVSRGATADIRHNFVSGNIYTPQTFAASGILLFGPGTVLTDHNTASSNDVSIWMIGTAPGSMTTQNRARASTFDGIAVDGTTGNHVADNQSDRNNGPGIGVYGANNNAVGDNKVEDNKDSGILLDFASQTNDLGENKVQDNGTTSTTNPDATDGIRVNDALSTDNTIHDNRLRHNVTHDCHDNSVGTGTANTANFWINNDGKTSQPQGLCGEDDNDADFETSTMYGWDAAYPWYDGFGIAAAEYDFATAYATIDTESLLQLLPQIRLAGIRRATPSPNQ